MADTITTWTPISAPTDFRDDAVFDIDFKTKTVQVLVEQPIVAGENLSQFIKFQAPRFYDNIDLTEMMVNILYVSPAGNKGISAAVNTEYSDDMIRCGWLVPYAACPQKGTLHFVLEFVGADYTLKTTIASTPVLDSINDADVVPEPAEQAWYITLQANVSATLQAAQTALGRIERIFNALSTPASASEASEMIDESLIYVYAGSETGYTYGDWYYFDGEDWVSGGEYASTALTVDATLSVAGRAADAKAVGDALANQIDKDSTPQIRIPDETDADLYISDQEGNVLAKLQSGGIETKGFKGFQYITYKSESVTYNTLPLTLTVNHKFKKGDRVVLHVDRGAMPWDYGAYVNYYEDDRSILVGKRIDSAWIEHVITEDTDAIVATYTGQPSTAGMTVGDVYTLEVSLLGDIPIKPTVVTVKKDGTGDFDTLRGALDAIGTEANDVLNPYRIEIHAGTYDVMDDYTDAEISAAVYDQISFVGPKLLNGMYLVGIGAPGEVVLNGELDTTKFSSAIRGDISTLNCQGSCGFENLTVIANHLRYCVHDDFHTTIGKKPKRIVKDCIFRGYDISYNPGTTYGAGTSDSGCDYEFINCDFGENAGVHTLPTIAQKSFVHLVNCKGHGFRIGDQETSDPVDGYSIYQFDNCDFLWINHNMSDDVPHVIIRGCGGSSPIIQGSNLLLYDTGDVVAMRNGGFSQTCNVGEVTEWFSNAGHGPRFRKATSVNGASGIVVYKDANDTYIQTKGYVCTNRTALTTFALGDYIGIANSLPVVVSDASDAIGRIAYIDNSGNGYIKLNFGG